MDIKILQPLTIFILLCYYKGTLGHQLQISETNTSSVFVELLRGRDGLPGRDGMSGFAGPGGERGERGPQGMKGDAGLNGRVGAPGSVGPHGVRGLQGMKGYAGLNGERGPQGNEGPSGPVSGGATYIRWGKSSCSGVTGTELVYTGIAGGSWYNQEGGGSNYLCLPKVAEYSSTLRYRPGVQNFAPIHGTEYENPRQGIDNGNVPCAVCRVSTRSTVIMIPANFTCPPTWTREYYGYLMTQHLSHRRTTFECVDRDMESLPGIHANTDGAVFFHTEATCTTGLPCPPYNTHQELNCVVCTK